MIFTIKPNIGVNDLKFGMSPSEVRAMLRDEYKSFKRNPLSEYPCDHFPSLSLFVYYKASGKVEAMEFAKPAEVFFDDVNLFQLSFYELNKLLGNFESNLNVESDGLTAHELGIGAYNPFATEEPMATPESIIAFEKGYYE